MRDSHLQDLRFRMLAWLVIPWLGKAQISASDLYAALQSEITTESHALHVAMGPLMSLKRPSTPLFPCCAVLLLGSAPPFTMARLSLQITIRLLWALLEKTLFDSLGREQPSCLHETSVE